MMHHTHTHLLERWDNSHVYSICLRKLLFCLVISFVTTVYRKTLKWQIERPWEYLLICCKQKPRDLYCKLLLTSPNLMVPHYTAFQLCFRREVNFQMYEQKLSMLDQQVSVCLRHLSCPLCYKRCWSFDLSRHFPFTLEVGEVVPEIPTLLLQLFLLTVGWSMSL